MEGDENPEVQAAFVARTGSPFFVTTDVFDSGTVDFDCEGKEPMSFDMAMAHATEIVEEHGGTQFVVECRCIRKVTRGKVRITEVKTSKR